VRKPFAAAAAAVAAAVHLGACIRPVDPLCLQRNVIQLIRNKIRNSCSRMYIFLSF